MSATVSASERPGSYDQAKRKRARRVRRERGCTVYIAADELEAAGIDPYGAVPWYRCWGTRGGGVLIRLYKQP